MKIENNLGMQLPQDFIQRTKELIGDEWNDFYDALQAPSPTSIRINYDKIDVELDAEQVAWYPNGYYFTQRPQFTFDPLFHAGTYYVQEASSMIIGLAAKQLIEGDIKALDLCAAPGGKSTLLSSVLPEDSLLVSNEIVRARANILAENMMKWGNPSTIVTNNKPEDYTSLKHYFDLILVDAPCSGEGMFRKDEQAIEEWSVENVLLCANRQRDIINAIWDSLKPGGYLFYSTCTYNREENEQIVEWICESYDAQVVELEIQTEWGISTSLVKDKATYHFYPHKAKGEGLYFAAIRKGTSEEQKTVLARQKQKNKGKKTPSLSPSISENLVFGSERFTFYEDKGQIKVFPAKYYDDLLLMKSRLYILHEGITLGEQKGKDFIPHQSLALNTSLNRDYFETYEVDWLTAISFLRKEPLNLDSEIKGILLLTYKGKPLGFVKNLGNRANNLYPSEWRIRSAYTPDEVNVLDY